MSDIDLDFTGDAEPALPVQKCSVCGKPLSRYNNTGVCFHHPDVAKARRQAEREALRSRRLEKASQDELTSLSIQNKQESLARLAEERLALGEADRIKQELIFDLVCQDFDITRDEVVLPSRKTPFVEARQLLMYLLYNDTSLSYPAIGELLGGRDHTTVIHGANKIEAELQNDDMLRARVQRLRALYQST